MFAFMGSVVLCSKFIDFNFVFDNLLCSVCLGGQSAKVLNWVNWMEWSSWMDQAANNIFYKLKIIHIKKHIYIYYI